MPNFIDLGGKQFGRWTVLNEFERQVRGKRARIYWKCKCDCGKIKFISGENLRSGCSQSCGCLQKELLPFYNRTHGMSGTSEYRVWLGMKQRCYDKNATKYKNWGGRGIRVCKAWLYSFPQFLADMGTKPASNSSLDRIDTNGNYSPSNCRWATPREQRRNSRQLLRLFTHNGKTMCLSDWSDETGIARNTITQRIDYCRWTVEKALSTPIRRYKKKSQ